MRGIRTWRDGHLGTSCTENDLALSKDVMVGYWYVAFFDRSTTNIKTERKERATDRRLV